MNNGRLGALPVVFFSLFILFAAACGGDDDSGGSAINPNDADNDGFTVESGDCNDANPFIKPGAIDVPADGIDQDCSGEDAPDPRDVDDDEDGFTENDGDCRDTDPSINPEATDICGDGIDQDCAGGDTECSAVDGDQDGFTPAQGDCDDSDAEVSPVNDEVPYNGKDDDCDSETVDDDVDGDGFAKIGGGDCDDDDASIFPGADEVAYDDIDQDCSGTDLTDVDRDGFAGGTGGDDCDDLNPAVRPNGVDVCDDGLDQDCSGADLVCDDLDRDNDGFSTNDGDCNDNDGAIAPDATEITYNGVDDDCDPATKDDDIDGDGFTQNGGGDCDDNVVTIFPGATETPYDGIDQSCSGADLTDVDNDGFDGGPSGTDCDDARPDISPAISEIPYDYVDQNCDGSDYIDSNASEVSTSPGSMQKVRAAWNGQVYLVVWLEFVGPTIRLKAVVTDANGVRIGQPVEIATGAAEPKVASNGSDFLVVYRTNASYAAQIVSANGTLVGSEFAVGDPFPGNLRPALGPAVARGGGGYVVVAQDNSACDASQNLFNNGVMRAYTITSSGTVTPAGRVIDRNLSCFNDFALGQTVIAGNGTSFVAVWRDNGQYKGRALDSSGLTTGNEVNLFVLGGSETYALESNGSGFLLAYINFDGSRNIQGQFLTASANLQGGPFAISTALGDQIDPAVSTNGTDYIVSFSDGRWGYGAVYAQKLDSSGTLLETTVSNNYGAVADGSSYGSRFDLVWGSQPIVFWGSGLNGGAVKSRLAVP